MDLTELGFIKVAACSPTIAIANPDENGAAILAAYRATPDDCALVVTPELSVTGYTAEDLFFADDLRRATQRALDEVVAATDRRVLIVGAPTWLPDGRLVNCAYVLQDGRILGAVPKVAPPNYDEFYEQRWFATGRDVDIEIEHPDQHYRIAPRQIFDFGRFRLGIEICEDLWAPAPPSADLALAGAQIIANPSASPELVAKAEYRRQLVLLQSARILGGYLYAGAGPTESTKDVVFGGHSLIAENGQTLAESTRFALGTQTTIGEIDTAKIDHDRARNSTFNGSPRRRDVTIVRGAEAVSLETSERTFVRHPFVPEDEAEFDARAQEILAVQATGLARRVLAARSERLVIGLSGGLDSTLALLVCVDAVAKLDRRLRDVLWAITLPGPGTTAHTIDTTRQLARALDIELREIDIHPAVSQHLEDIDHEGEHDIAFENTQARERTQVLFDVANQVGGIVVGTGDLSELALGWCTFNADHMANYNVNASVPKTLVAYLVRWYARHRAGEALAAPLERVLDTPITPELIPTDDDTIVQETEAIVGPYELHDFFLYHFLRHGAGAAKIYLLACRAFQHDYPPSEIKRWQLEFFRRFFAQQFKRTTLPPGPKVGTVSLSPRGDWRMPDEANAASILDEIQGFDDSPLS